MIFNENYLKSLQKINEVYIGKNKEILAIEQQLGKFRSKYIGSIDFNSAYHDPELRKFESMIEDYFGFDCFNLQVQNQRVANVFTYPIGMRFDIKKPKKMVISNKNGFKFKKEAKFAGIVCIYSAVIFNEFFSDEEVMAVILHEIGHNFQTVLNNQCGILTGYHKALMIPVIFISILLDPAQGIANTIELIPSISNTYQRIGTNLTRHLIDADPIFEFGLTILHQASDVINGLKIEIQSLPDVLTLGIFNVAMALYSSLISIITIINPINVLIMGPIKLKNKMGEQISDNFATIYGYGPALSSALTKLEDSKSDLRVLAGTMKGIPVFGKLYQMNSDIAMIIMSKFDEHPHNVKRISSQIAMLENELKQSNLKPEMKKRIQDDLKQIKKDAKLYLDSSNGIKNNNFIAKAYARYLSENTNSRLKAYLDGREAEPIIGNSMAIEKDRFKQYDDIFNRIQMK